jgi:uncharacterized membrane protein
MDLSGLVNLPHLHLLLNHFPIIGTFMGLALLLVAVVSRHNDLKKASLMIFALIALFAMPAYTTGHAAAAVIQGESNVSAAIVENHQGAALIAFIFLEITGAFAWLGLWRSRRAGSPASWIMPTVLVLALASAGLLTITGSTGGEISHPEIFTGDETPSFIAATGSALFTATQQVVLVPSRWGGVWPVLEEFHFLGLILLLGTIGLLDLRIFGFFKALPLAPLLRFVPWAIAGFAMNVITGMLFFVGMPAFYVYNADFHVKVFGVLLAGANILLFFCTDAFSECDLLGPNEDAPPFARFFAATSLLLVFAVIVLGRYMPFFEESLAAF